MPLNAVLVGLGMVADTHLNALMDLKEKVNLRGVYARSQDACIQYADKCSKLQQRKCRAYSSLEELLEDEEIDFAILATPPNARLEYVEAFSAAGIDILMEKPIERNWHAANQIVQLCKAAGIKLGIVFQHRMRSASIELSNLIASNTLGPLHIVDVRVPWWREQSYYDEPGRGTFERDGGGVLISQAIHTLDLMLSLIDDEVSEVQAMSRTTGFHSLEAEDFVSAGFSFRHGAVGSLCASTAHYPGRAESIEMYFENASLILESGTLLVNWRDGKVEKFGQEASTGGGADPMAFTHDWHASIIEEFIGAVENGREPITSGTQGLKVHKLIDALLESSRDGRVVKL